MNQPPTVTTPGTASKKAFQAGRPEIRNLVKQILAAERRVIHMERRSDIHEDILTTVKDLIQ
jgi:hypothetical protein